MTFEHYIYLYYKCIALLTLTIIISCWANDLILPITHRNQCMPQAIFKVLDKYYSRNFATLIWSKDAVVSEEMVSLYHLYTGCTMSLGRDDSYNSTNLFYEQILGSVVTQYVVYINNVNDFQYFLSRVENNKIFANYGKFIIICIGDKQTANGCNFRKLFDICWNYYLVNVIVLHRSRVGSVTAYTYYPMSEGQCGNTEPKALDDIDNYIEHNAQTNLFPQKFFNFNGCSLILSTAALPPFTTIKTDAHGELSLGGLYGPIFPLLSKIMNATLKIILPKGEQIYGEFNGTHWRGVMNDVLIRRANLTTTMAVRSVDAARTFRSIYPFRTVNMGWITPPVPLRPAWEKLLNPFDRQLWLALIICFLILVFVSVLLKETCLKILWDKYFPTDPIGDSMYIDACAIFLEQPTTRRPSKAALLFCLALWIWFGFFIGNAYVAALFGVLKQDVFVSDLDTLPNAIKAGYAFGGQESFQADFIDEPDFYKEYKFVKNDINSHLEAAANGSVKFVFLIGLDLMAQFNAMPNHTHFLRVIPQSTFGKFITEYLPPDSPLVDTLSVMYGRIVSSGIPVKLSSEFYNFIKIGNFKRQRNENETLTIHHMAACFLLVAGGWLLCIIVFFIELIWNFVYSNIAST